MAQPVTTPDLLTAETLLPYLRTRGLIDDTPVSVRELTGGVSSLVFALDGKAPLVVKQSLPELRVATAWSAPQDRTLTEAEAIDLCSGLAPGRAPRLLDVDPDRFVICIERAPRDWVDWKQALLAGRVSEHVGTELGRTLAGWHNATAGGLAATPRLSNPGAFELLRVGPYFRTVAESTPELRAELDAVIEDLHSHRSCLTHGDLSPKNILVGPRPGDLIVIDFEVAHLGDPAFDVAFLLSHLILKSLHLPGLADQLDRSMRSFLDVYTDCSAASDQELAARSLRYAGALLLARVRGKSPAEYLDQPGRRHAWSLGTTLLRDRVPNLDTLPDLRRKATL